MTDSRRDHVTVTLVALLARLVVAVWAGARIPPTADGTYYHLLATRIATGQGYTWLWPDGVVTYAAHYPVGYPALIAGGYFVFGAKPLVAMLINALIGTAGAWAAYDLLKRCGSARFALAGGIVVALHPALVPYTAAIMTEGVTAALLLVAAALAARAHDVDASERFALRGGLRWLVASGLVLGVATLVRPQCVALAPIFGWAAARFRGGAIVLALSLAVCAPWTARNCSRMDQCALVSVNGGWNLAIGTQTKDGGWQEMAVPDACKEVFAEAAKDACFGREARAEIERRPEAWLARIPAKLRVTFDYIGAAPWYLHAANAEAFPYAYKYGLGAIETVATRLLLIAALVSVRKLRGPNRLLREAITAVGLVSCFVVGAAALAYLACAIAILALGRDALARAPRIVPMTAAVVLLTAATHAVFFGSGRYGLVVIPFIAVLAFVRDDAQPSAGEPCL